MTSGPVPVCFHCARLEEWPFCTAFGPHMRIPLEIASGAHAHQEPVPGDHGRLYQEADADDQRRINRTHGFPQRANIRNPAT